MTDDYFRDQFARPTWEIPTGAPCLPTAGSTNEQIRDHTDKWHPDHHYGRAYARRLCANCPALNACLTANLHEKDGIWGGTTPEDRKQLRGEADAA